MPMHNPPHVGDFIRTEIFEPRGLTVTDAAKALRVWRTALRSLLNGRPSEVSPMRRRRVGPKIAE